MQGMGNYTGNEGIENWELWFGWDVFFDKINGFTKSCSKTKMFELWFIFFNTKLPICIKTYKFCCYFNFY